MADANDMAMDFQAHGYDIRPSALGRGLGTTILRLTLQRAAARGLPMVLLTCDADNVASRRVIENNRGVLTAWVRSADGRRMICRYAIALDAAVDAR